MIFEFVVLNLKNVEKYLTNKQKDQLELICASVTQGRNHDGKKINSYLVVNTDEPYAEKIREIIKIEESYKK